MATEQDMIVKSVHKDGSKTVYAGNEQLGTEIPDEKYQDRMHVLDKNGDEAGISIDEHFFKNPDYASVLNQEDEMKASKENLLKELCEEYHVTDKSTAINRALEVAFNTPVGSLENLKELNTYVTTLLDMQSELANQKNEVVNLAVKNNPNVPFVDAIDNEVGSLIKSLNDPTIDKEAQWDKITALVDMKTSLNDRGEIKAPTFSEMEIGMNESLKKDVQLSHKLSQKIDGMQNRIDTMVESVKDTAEKYGNRINLSVNNAILSVSKAGKELCDMTKNRVDKVKFEILEAKKSISNQYGQFKAETKVALDYLQDRQQKAADAGRAFSDKVLDVSDKVVNKAVDTAVFAKDKITNFCKGIGMKIKATATQTYCNALSSQAQSYRSIAANYDKKFNDLTIKAENIKTEIAHLENESASLNGDFLKTSKDIQVEDLDANMNDLSEIGNDIQDRLADVRTQIKDLKKELGMVTKEASQQEKNRDFANNKADSIEDRLM